VEVAETFNAHANSSYVEPVSPGGSGSPDGSVSGAEGIGSESGILERARERDVARVAGMAASREDGTRSESLGPNNEKTVRARTQDVGATSRRSHHLGGHGSLARGLANSTAGAITGTPDGAQAETQSTGGAAADTAANVRAIGSGRATVVQPVQPAAPGVVAGGTKPASPIYACGVELGFSADDPLMDIVEADERGKRDATPHSGTGCRGDHDADSRVEGTRPSCFIY
jgi:hypothetical protein